jgi:predicted acylesterase/phospholipase RssA
MELNHIDTVILSGGGIKCVGYLGFFTSLFSKIKKSQIKHYVGTSAGCIFSLMLVLGYDLSEIRKIIFNYNYNVMIPEINIDNIFLNCGLSDGEKIKDFIIQLIEYKKFDQDMTFLDFFEKTNIKLTMTLTNFTKQCVEYINYETNPTFKILDAVLATSRIPLFFSPYKINDDIYLDGAVINNYPINYIDDDKLNNVIGACYIVKRSSEDVKKILENNDPYEKIIHYIYNVMLLNINNVLYIINDEQKKRTVNLENNISGVIDFDMSSETKNKIIQHSYQTTEKFLDDNFMLDYLNDSDSSKSNESNHAHNDINSCVEI